MTDAPGDWAAHNQASLAAALSEVASFLGREEAVTTHPWPTGLAPPSALDAVTAAFGLSAFERAVLVMCAGQELEASFGELCAKAAGEPAAPWPTFSLALTRLPEPHWTAIAPQSPLRRWQLVEVTGHGPVTRAELRIDEHVLHYLAGVADIDPKLTGIVTPHADDLAPTAGQRAAAHILPPLWERPGLPVAVLVGSEQSTRQAVAAHAAEHSGAQLALLDAQVLPVEPAARDQLARLLERASVLSSTVYLAECGENSAEAIDALAALTRAPLAISADTAPALRRRAARIIDVPRATSAEQRGLWQEYGPDGVVVEPLVAAFDLDAASIRAAAAAAASDPDALWPACRAIDRPQLSAHAQRIESQATWDDLVLPESSMRALSLLTAHARHRVTVYDDWGMRKGRTAGLGSAAVFSGPSGTGKTFAAEVIANDLQLDLYRVDLSAVVSKYIGETEKNLRQVFDAADHGSAVLLFDEADALFGKRTEVSDSHDRYANVEVSYLLQRMEAYRGLAILTTNMAEAIDAAFLRRVRFVVEFPFPDEAMRADLWCRAFPDEAPQQGLDIPALARLALAGGTIRNVAVNAAFLAADASEPISMAHVMTAARIESSKLGKPLGSLRKEPIA